MKIVQYFSPVDPFTNKTSLSSVYVKDERGPATYALKTPSAATKRIAVYGVTILVPTSPASEIRVEVFFGTRVAIQASATAPLPTNIIECYAVNGQAGGITVRFPIPKIGAVNEAVNYYATVNGVNYEIKLDYVEV